MSDETENNEGGLKSRAGLIGAAVMLVLLMAMGVFVAVMAIVDDGGDTTAPPTPATEASPTEEPSDPDESVCGLPGHETKGNVSTPPENTNWTLIRKMAIPASDAAGPGVVEESGLRYCYAHTPEGALLAAVNMFGWAAAALNDPDGIFEHNIAAGPGREALRAHVDEWVNTPVPIEPPQLRGFRLLNYSGESAYVDLAFEANGGYTHLQIEVAWEEGDWKVRLQPDGAIPPFQPLPDLTGYVLWAGA